jgi:flagella basal body P-ring formation protein FlgA
MLAAGAAPGDRIALDRTAEVRGEEITLADVAELSGEYAERFADVPLAEFPAGQSKRTLSLNRIRERLNQREAHWGRLQLSGALKVQVRRASAPDVGSGSNKGDGGSSDADRSGSSRAEQTRPASTDGDAEANPLGSVSVNEGATPGGLTLRRQIVRFIRNEVDAAENELRISFRDPNDPLLATGIQEARFEIKPLTSTPIGRVPLVVRRYEGGEPTDTHRIRLKVEIRRKVLVANRSIGRGQTVTEDDVHLKTAWLDSKPSQLVRDPAEVIGQRADGLLRSGDLIQTDDIEPPLLIERGQMVIVRCVSGGVVVRTVARAREDGHAGQSIELRNERTRETFRAKVTGPKEAVLKTGSGGRTPGRARSDREDAS